MDTLKHKGYRGSVHFSSEDRVLHGRILGISDMVNFEGRDVDELESAFQECVDDYLAMCEKLGRNPDREYSGRIPLRIDEELHKKVAIEAERAETSVNSWIASALEHATREKVSIGKVSKAARRGRKSTRVKRRTQ